MSDEIPFEIQMEVMKLLPIKSLIQFRCVSKPWKSVIESSDFIADYTVSSRDQPHHLLISYQNNENDVYVSIADNDSFPLNKYSPNVPPPVNRLRNSFIVGTSRGLVCLFGYYQGPRKWFKRNMFVLWNPSIRKSVAIAVPDGVIVSSTFGFGGCPATGDPKIVTISKFVTWQVEVFNLSSGVWRISPCNPPDKLVEFNPSTQSHIDRFIYWLGVTGRDTGIIISFDLLSEEFGEIHLPITLAVLDLGNLYLFKRSDSLVVLNETIVDEEYDVWMTENGISKSFNKIFTVNMPNGLYTSSLPLGFSRNGEIMMVVDDTDDSDTLVAYDPLSEHINDIGINGRNSSLNVSSFTESLILLDKKDTLFNEEMSI
ncbi:F-box protein At5g62510-like [Bidens hawaiensis]|uniref:F-box protein At5g62510-like n=1 Tax=Bidens hawaiensis TaxID=980011 RepID=UPI00404A01D8